MKNTVPSPLRRRPWNRSVVLAAILLSITILSIIFHRTGAAAKYDIPHLLYPARLRPSPSQHDATYEQKAPNVTKAIITSVQRKDETSADWILEELPDWQPYIYVTDRTSDETPDGNLTSLASLTSLPVNRGREASVYLTYIVQHYYDLPDIMVFIHGKRYQIHNDDPMLDTLPEISRLNLDYVQSEGYTSLRCNWMHCPKPQVEPELGYEDGFWDTRGLYASAWTEFFPSTPIPPAVTGPCCAQFAVTRDVVHRWPVDKYEQIRQWMWTQEGDEASMKSGLVLEYMWHILFGKPAVFCPDAKECYCKKWGLCDLECENEGWCLGRVWLNPNKNAVIGLPPQLPVNWPKEGQPEKGGGGLFPYEGWWDDEEVRKEH